MSWKYRRRLSLTDRVMTLPYRGYGLRISADGKLLSEVDSKLEELLHADPILWIYNPAPPALEDVTSKETDSPSLVNVPEQEEIKPKRRRRATKRAK